MKTFRIGPKVVTACEGKIVCIGDGAKINIIPNPSENSSFNARTKVTRQPPAAPQEERRPQRVRNQPTVHCQESSGEDGFTYKINTGYVLILNNQYFPSRQDVERSGSEQDVRSMKEFFEDVGLHPIQERSNLDSSQMRQLFKDIAEKDFSKYDCFICVILSHGSEDGIMGVDNTPIQVDYITSLFRGTECPSLKDKPKLFFIQACRGSEQDVAVESDSEPIQVSYPKLPADSDFLVCYASSPGLQSYRSPDHGSWFISSVAQVFHEYAGSEHVMDMMLRVNKKVAEFFSSTGLKQMPSEVCMLTKKVFFNAPNF